MQANIFFHSLTSLSFSQCFSILSSFSNKTTSNSQLWAFQLKFKHENAIVLRQRHRWKLNLNNNSNSFEFISVLVSYFHENTRPASSQSTANNTFIIKRTKKPGRERQVHVVDLQNWSLNFDEIQRFHCLADLRHNLH